MVVIFIEFNYFSTSNFLKQSQKLCKSLYSVLQVLAKVLKPKLFPKTWREMEHIAIKDGSRLSTEANAPLFQHRMTGTTFVSSIDIGSVNLLRVHFHLMYTFFLLSFNLINPKTCQKSIILALRKHNITFIEPAANGVF